jgi:hypothetical protein
VETFAPTGFELWAYVHAGEWAAEHSRYGFPYPGTIRDQPVVWRLAVDCHADATTEGRLLAEDHAEADRKEKEEQDEPPD